MTGNVWEWMDSWYDDSKDARVFRGGSWRNTGRGLTIAFRNYFGSGDHNFRFGDIGFRCAQY